MHALPYWACTEGETLCTLVTATRSLPLLQVHFTAEFSNSLRKHPETVRVKVGLQVCHSCCLAGGLCHSCTHARLHTRPSMPGLQALDRLVLLAHGHRPVNYPDCLASNQLTPGADPLVRRLLHVQLAAADITLYLVWTVDVDRSSCT